MKRTLLAVLLALCGGILQAQVGVNNSNPDASSELDVTSTTRGFLAPRMTGAQMAAIASPATGLAVYNTDSASYCIYNGSAWLKVLLSTASNWTASGTNIYNGNSGNVGVGTSTPVSKFQLTNGNLLVSGTYGSGSTLEITGSGTRMFFNPKKGAFRAGGVSTNTVAWNDGNLGGYSFAAGLNTTATGGYSIAMGSATRASGANSMATGDTSVASNYVSFAHGYLDSATGRGSVAFGLENTAPSYAETVFGYNATKYTPISTSDVSSSDRLFNIGNGSSSSLRSDAFTILKSGNTGIGTSTPLAKLHIVGGSIYATGTFTGDNSSLPLEGAGTRMMWWPELGAFRAGTASETGWNSVNVGKYSVAFGEKSQASGDYSIAMGNTAEARNTGSVAIGEGCVSSGANTICLGYYASTRNSNTTQRSGCFVFADRLNAGSGSNDVYSYNNFVPPANNTFSVRASGGLYFYTDLSYTASTGLFFKSGKLGVGQDAPASSLEVNGAMAATVKTGQVAGTNNPDNTGEFWFYTAGSGNTITLPTSSCTNRMYTIVNQTSGSVNITGYKNLSGTLTTTLANGTSVSLVFDGTNWLQYK